MKKILSTFVITALSFFMISSVKAASANISVKASSKVTIGNTFTVTITVSSSANLGSWDFTMNYDKSKLSLVSWSSQTAQHAVDTASSSGVHSRSYTYKFKAKSLGNAKIYVESADVVDWDSTQSMSVNRGSATVSIGEPVNYSSNNDLSSLSVEKTTLSPAFDKNKLEYTATFPAGTTSMLIKATAADPKSNIQGAGQVNITEGDNTISIKVTAENGNVKTYVIKVFVPEANPIQVKIGEQEYTVVKKAEYLRAPANYKATTVKINDFDIPAFYSEITKLTLVGMKDKDGRLSLYVYQDGQYTLYQEISFSRILFYPLSFLKKDIPSGYQKYTLTVGGKKIDGYRLSKEDPYTLVYGMNIETGEKHIYSYDAKEETLQRFYENNSEENKINSNITIKIIIFLTCICLSLIILLLFVLRRQKKIYQGKV